jgi:hypothetical protein
MILVTISCLSPHQCVFSAIFFNSVNKFWILYHDPCLLEINAQSWIWYYRVQTMCSLCVLGHTIHQTSQLFHHCLYQLLFVSVILPELSKYIVLFASILHPRNICEWRSLEERKLKLGCHKQDILACFELSHTKPTPEKIYFKRTGTNKCTDIETTQELAALFYIFALLIVFSH